MKKSYTRMLARELADATREFDKPGAADKFKPLTRAQRKKWNEMVRHTNRGGAAAKDDIRVLVSIDPELLVKAHRHARKYGHTLSQLVAEGLEATLKRRSA